MQGVDYAYTLQGWLKGVNSATGASYYDMGLDSATVAKDAYGYSLGYYPNDYTPIGGTGYHAFTLQYSQTVGDITGQSLYNGNISNSTLAVNDLNSGSPVGYTYHYDQLNRLKKMRQYAGIHGTSWSRSNITLNYQENASYDGNGNILTYGRNGVYPTTAQTIDSLTYNYNYTDGRLVNNKLNYLHDAVAGSGYNLDLRNQTSTTNYQYDAIGNLIADAYSGITGIGWTVYNKPDTIYKAAGNITYTYNTANERVSQTVNGVTTWYIRDAQGNVLAIYNNAHSAVNWMEQHLYGSGRLGIWLPDINIATGNALNKWDSVGFKRIELDNHLGNVLATITDKRLQNGSPLSYFTADVASAQDYYPFGMLQPGRQYTFGGDSTYRYGFNGKENDNEVKGLGNQQDYGMRIYDPRVGRFLSTDPFAKSYPYLTPYQFASNKPINSIDVDGAEAMEIIHWMANTGTSRQSAQLIAPYAQSVFHINEKQTMLAFGIANGIISGADAIGLSEQYKRYSNDAIKQLFSMRYNTFMQEDLSFDKIKKMIPELRMAEDSYNGIRNAINAAYAGDSYAAGQVFGMCLTANIEGLNADGINALRGLGGRGVEAAEILEANVPKPELKTVNTADVTTSTKYEPTNEMLGKRVGHTWEKHGSHNTNQLKMQAENTKMDVGQWTNDAFAEKLISDNLKNLKNGTITVEIPAGVGRVIHPDGTTSTATHAVIVPSGSGVKTAYPVQ